MILINVVETKADGSLSGHGGLNFAAPPRVGELVHIPGAGPSLEFYTVETVEHSPVRSQLPSQPQPTPRIMITVRWSHDWSPEED